MEQQSSVNPLSIPLIVLVILILGIGLTTAIAQDKKPNIVIIWGDDIGQSNISAYSKA